MRRKGMFCGFAGAVGLLGMFATACQAPSGGPGLTPGAHSTTPRPSTPPVVTPTATPGPVPSQTPAALQTLSLTGRVTDLERLPLAEVILQAVLEDGTASSDVEPAVVASARTDGEGRYDLELPAGAYRISAGKDGFTPREQTVQLTGNQTLDFGPSVEDGANPYGLSDDLEVTRVEVLEDAPGGPLALKMHLSEPLSAAARKAFEEHLVLEAASSQPFLRPSTTTAYRLKVTGDWDTAGQVYTFRYQGPYLASGEVETRYALSFEQDELETKDPVTRELEWEDLGIVDADGNHLGRGRVDYAFKRAIFYPLILDQLADKTYGYFMADRRWRLTHEGVFSFVAQRDNQQPGLERAEMRLRQSRRGASYDELTLYFSEPMHVAKNREELEYHRFDKDREMAILNVSGSKEGDTFKPLGSSVKLQGFVFDPDYPERVIFQYPGGSFANQERVEVYLGTDLRDPAGNKADPARLRAVGPILK